ncbi:GTPase [Sediminivirga luteola]|uniref:G domain-containing protein n=1 Tax=Sediminivirga luteola TaxID=1774748 RepID=A0A8J2XL96_9MICO|nr:GTPase [Sediminivirga luteola]GGA20936.1 hypothetical protein GCM10011333_25040 [Sediminivirga luteola]
MSTAESNRETAAAQQTGAGELDRLMDGIGEALGLGEDKLSAPVRAEAEAVLAKASARRRISESHTVVAFAGSTGSGKSSLFNAVAGLEIARVGAKRPTTSLPTACIWGSGGEEILDWLKVPQRHRTWRESALDADDQRALHGLILLDLPDHDSTEVEHKIESDRMIELVDVLIWVVDPQKYADHALHARYLRPLAGHAEVMVVVLNQIDTLDETERDACLAHLRTLLDEDGLAASQLRSASAITREGVGELRELLAATLQTRQAAQERLLADARSVAERIRDELGAPVPSGAAGSPAERGQLVEAMTEAAGVPAIASTVHADYLRRSHRATAYPLTAWRSRSGPDPLGSRHEQSMRAELRREALPSTNRSHRARVGVAAQKVAAGLAEDLPPSWQTEIAEAARTSTRQIGETLDEALGRVDITPRRPAWWGAVRALQLLFLALTVAGALWLLVQIVLGSLGVPPFAGSVLWWVLPGGLLVAGAAGSAITSLLASGARRRGADRAAAEVDERLRGVIAEVADHAYLSPLTSVVERHRRLVERLRPEPASPAEQPADARSQVAAGR